MFAGWTDLWYIIYLSPTLIFPGQNTWDEHQSFHCVLSSMASLLNLQRSLALRLTGNEEMRAMKHFCNSDQNPIFLFGERADPFMVVHLIVFWILIPWTLHTLLSCLYGFWVHSSIKHIFPIIKWHSCFSQWRGDAQQCLLRTGI